MPEQGNEVHSTNLFQPQRRLRFTRQLSPHASCGEGAQQRDRVLITTDQSE